MAVHTYSSRDFTRDVSAAKQATADGPVVGCRWSSPSAVPAAGVRLIRFDPAVDPYRTVVLRTDDVSVTEYLDRDVRVGHRYGYAVQVVGVGGRLVGRSRAEWVGVPVVDEDVDLLRLGCTPGSSGATIECEWSRPVSPPASVVSLWRSVDDGPRALVGQFRPSGPNSYRDTVPSGARQVTYAVVVTSASDDSVARSRPAIVRIPAADPPRATDRARAAP